MVLDPSSQTEKIFMKFIWKILAGICGIGFVVILILAYLKGIPSFISAVPYYDKVGHFLLFGIVGYVLHRVTKRKYVSVFPLAVTLFSVFTVLEEGMQIFSVNRTFSFSDLIFSLVGIWVFFLIDYYYN